MNTPHGPQAVLIQQMVSPEKIPQMVASHLAGGGRVLSVSNRIASDCVLIGNGAYSPLTGFMGKDEAHSVIEKMRLLTGCVWGLPILFPVSESDYQKTVLGETILLQDSSGQYLAKMDVQEKFELNLSEYCRQVYQTDSENHPGVQVVKSQGNCFLAGPILSLMPHRPEVISPHYYQTPAELREVFASLGWQSIVAFQTRNPIHRAHEYLIKCALEMVDGALIHPLVGETKADDIPATVRMACYEALLEKYFNPKHIYLSVLPAAMRYAGPREALHHSIMRKNYGCTHMIIGRDHAGVGQYYGTYDAQKLMATFSEELGIRPINFENTYYSKTCQSVVSDKTCPPHSENVNLSGTKVREMLQAGIRPPEEFTRPEVADILIAWATQN